MLSLVFTIGIAGGITAVIHAYLWLRLIRPARLPRPWALVATLALVVMFASVPLTTASRFFAPHFAATFGWVSMTWLALVGLTFVIVVALDVARLGAWGVRKARRAPDVSMSRRLFLTRVTGGAAVAVAGASVAGGMIAARGEHEVVDVEVAIGKLPKALDGFTIVQLSDLHVGMTIDRAFVQRVVDKANALSPDLIALTGDLIDGTVEDLRDDVAPLAALRAKHGVYAVTGNHEYYAGVDPWIAEITRLGARYLRNERVAIADGLDLAGVDDYGAHNYAGHGEDLDKALGDRDRARAVVLLAHQPRQVRRASQFGVDLQLSGHTHGGQIWPWHYMVKLQQRGLLAGRYEHAGTQLYVTRGCGYWGPPVRLLAPLEITRVILRAA